MALAVLVIKPTKEPIPQQIASQIELGAITEVVVKNLTYADIQRESEKIDPWVIVITDNKFCDNMNVESLPVLPVTYIFSNGLNHDTSEFFRSGRAVVFYDN